MDSDLYVEFQQWTNEQMRRIVIESRQARIALLNEAMHLVDMMKTIYPRDSHWANIEREEAREIFHQLVRDCMAIVDTVLVGSTSDNTQEVPTVEEEVPTKKRTPLPTKKKKRNPAAPPPPSFLPRTVNSRLGDKKKTEEDEAKRKRKVVDANTAMQNLARTMHRFYFDLVLDAKRAAGAEVGSPSVVPPSPNLSSAEEALFFCHSIYMSQLNERCTNWAAQDIQLERAGYLYRHPECKLIVPERSADENMAAVTAYNDITYERMEKYEKPEAIAKRRNFTPSWALESLMYNIPYVPGDKDGRVMDTIISPVNTTLTDRPITQAKEMERMDNLFEYFYQTWHLPPDWSNFKGLGRRTTLANIITGTGLLTSTLVSSALGVVPWVVRIPLSHVDITLSDEFDRTARNRGVSDSKPPEDKNSGEYREEERYREALEKIRTTVVMERKMKGTGNNAYRYPRSSVVVSIPETKQTTYLLLARRPHILDDAIALASEEAPMRVSVSSRDHTVNVVDHFLAETVLELLALSPSHTVETTNLFTDYLESISPKGTQPLDLLHGILRIYTQVPVLEALPVNNASPLLLFRQERINTAGNLAGITNPMLTVDEEIKLDERSLREMLGVVFLYSTLQTIFGHLAGPAGAVDLEGVDSFRHSPPECKVFGSIYMRFLTRAERSLPKWLWHALREIDIVSKCGGYGPLHMNNDGGDPTSTPGIRSFTIAMDIASLTTRMAIFRRIFGHHISIWRRAVLIAAVTKETTTTAPRPSAWSAIVSWFTSAVRPAREGEEAKAPAIPKPDPYYLRFVRVFDVSFTTTIAEVFGHLTVGASNYAGVLTLSGIPYDFEMAHRYCVQASLLGGITTEGLAQLAEVASDLAREERMGLTPLPTGFGATLQLIDWMTTDAVRRAIAEGEDKTIDVNVLEWMKSCMEFTNWIKEEASAKGKKMTETDQQSNTFCENYLQIVRSGKKKKKKNDMERINKRIKDMANSIPIGFLANGLMLKYRLRRHLAIIGQL